MSRRRSAGPAGAARFGLTAMSRQIARMFSLEGKTAVITGGGRGIGRGIALAYAKCGANLVLTGRAAEVLEVAAADLRGIGAEVLILPGDITDLAEIHHIAERAQERFGYIDCWVNNAGSAAPADVGRLIDLTEKQFDNVVDLNFKAAFFAAQAAARAMTRGGSIINITSRSASQPCPITGHYGGSKAAMESLTATMSVEWGHLGIRVNAIAPGLVLTERSSSADSPSRQKRQAETVPLRRLGHVDDIAGLAVYFAADESAWVTGQVVQVNGGSRLPVGLLTYLHRINREMDEREANGLEVNAG